MYPTGPGFLKELLRHKEFYELKSDPERNFRDPEDAIDLNVGQYLKIHSHQIFGKNFMGPNTSNRSAHLNHATGTGKCHDADTLILMYNGITKRAADIQVNDLLMGPDGCPRVVLSTCSGYDRMYRISSSCGESFICNEPHVMTLRSSYGITCDIGLDECIKYHEESGQVPGNLFKMPVSWPSYETKIDPIAAAHCIIDFKQSVIPANYKINDVLFLRQFLSVIVNRLGSPHPYGAKLTSPHGNVHLNDIIPDLKFIARSLGMDIRPYEKNKSISWVLVGNFDLLYVIKKYNIVTDLDTAWSYEYIGVGKYYGFSLSGDGRYLLDSFIVTHNTLAALVIAQEFIKSYEKIYDLKVKVNGSSRRSHIEADKDTPSVYVLGFGGTKAAFVRDLLAYPEFGFVSVSESEELISRQKQAVSGLPEDIKSAKELASSFKKRITQKSKGGFYKFYGYDEFVNRLFPAGTVDITDLEVEAERSLRTDKPVTLGELITQHIEAGTIQVNESFMKQFEGSLIIGDEIHNTYNMNMKNKRGVAIQYVLDHVSTCKFVSLSATPINNSPTEIIELANYHLPRDAKITKREFFTNNRTMRPGMLEKLSSLLNGKWSFLQDTNLKYFPKRIISGERVKLNQQVSELNEGALIPYLNFITCPMSDLHQATYDDFIRTQLDDSIQDDVDAEDEDQENLLEAMSSGTAIPADGYTIYDMAFPNPDNSSVGIFKSSEVRNKLLSSNEEWRKSVGIEIKRRSASDYIISGPFLYKKNIAKYNTKLAKTLEIIEDTLQRHKSKLASGIDINLVGEKMVIYHNRVKMSGVLQIYECLRINGYLDETSEPTDNTLCLCGTTLEKHAKVPVKHEFIPVRILLAHSDMDKSAMDASISKFNSINNTHGTQALIFIGSKIIKESYDFKAVRRELILSLPINIPTLEQVIGRVVRKKSHATLEESERTAEIMILLTTSQHSDQNSPEMQKYAEKLLDYREIQEILRKLNAGAIDADIHRDTIMTEEMKKIYFPDGPNSKPVDTLGNLYFDPDTTVSYKPHELTLSTFNAYGYWIEEVRTIMFILKQLFMIQPVWTYEDLWDKVRSPPIGVEVNPKLFVEGNFIIALNSLVQVTPTINLSGSGISHTTLIERMFDPMDRIIIVDGAQYVINVVSKYYIRTPIITLVPNPINVNIPDTIDIWKKTYSSHKQIALLDAETYHRHPGNSKSVIVPVSAFAKANTESQYIASLDTLLVEPVISTILTYNESLQVKLVEESIVSLLTKTKSKYISLYKRVIEFMDSLGVIVSVRVVSKYKDTVKLFKNGVSGLPETAIGYCNAKSIKLYDDRAKKWLEVSRVSLNKQANYKENDVVIGHLESSPSGDTKFKLRKPIQQIREAIKEDTITRQQAIERTGVGKVVAGDTRLIERGIVCETKPKTTLIDILRRLGIRDTTKLQLTSMKIKQLCKMIKSRLLELEISERSTKSRVKYLYGWWDEQISIASQV